MVRAVREGVASATGGELQNTLQSRLSAINALSNNVLPKVLALAAFAVLLLAGITYFIPSLSYIFPAWARVWPREMGLPFVEIINAVVDFLKNQHLLFGITFRDITRLFASAIEVPLYIVEGILVSGFPAYAMPSLPWTSLVGLAFIFGWWLKGARLAILASSCIFYMALFGKWTLSLITLSVVLVAAPIAMAIGLAVGIASARSLRVERIAWPLLNVMQSLPHFSYLIPVAIFIGVSHKAGVIATILFAFPPMARLTLVGLRGVSSEVREAGLMAGCTARQMLWRVELPSALQALLLGVNQVVMQCLAMVVISSFIGAKGLGQDLLFRLQSLRIGQALEIGVAIVFVAVTLDRISIAFSQKKAHSDKKTFGAFWRRFPYSSTALGLLLITFIGAAINPAWQRFPEEWTITTAPMWDALVIYITVHWFDALSIFRDGFLIYVLIPIRNLFQWLPWPFYLLLVAASGYRLGGIRLATTVSLFILFIVFSGYWARSTITAYMVFVSLLCCLLLGLPLGIWASLSERRARGVMLVCDSLQTFPSFIYLIPVIMLFRVGDVAAIMAVVIYASIPIVRYSIFGLRGVAADTIEAAITSGATTWQILWKVRMPLALPEIMLGINQTIMFSLFMVTIAAFIGTTDLGQEIFKALTFNDAGKGLVVGLCIAFMGLAVDRLGVAWAERRKKQYDSHTGVRAKKAAL